MHAPGVDDVEQLLMVRVDVVPLRRNAGARYLTASLIRSSDITTARTATITSCFGFGVAASQASTSAERIDRTIPQIMRGHEELTARVGPVEGDGMLRWLGTPGIDAVEQDGTIEFGAGPISDWFVDPRTGSTTSSAPGAVVETGGVPFTVSCGVDAELAATFDAVAMFVHYDDTHWLKFAVELSPDGRVRLVTVRTADASDDCNHEVVTSPRCRLRATVDEHSIALHARTAPDGPWDLIRYCPAPGTGTPTLALLVQSPTGQGLRGRFDDVQVEQGAVESLRDGS